MIETTSLSKGTRVRLREDFTGAFGRSFKAGQAGRVLYPPAGGLAVVDFDGYEKERQWAERFQAEHGEGPNIVPWLSEIPERLLDIQDD